MTFKRLLATAIVCVGLALIVPLVALFIWALVSAFIADFPVSLYAVLATPPIIAAVVGLVLLGTWAWENRWKP